MPNYSEEESRKRIEKHFGPLEQGLWEKILKEAGGHPGSGMPYDESDIKDLLTTAKRLVPLPRALSKTFPLQVSQIEYPAIRIQASEAIAKRLESRAKKLRAFLGLKSPLKSERLESWLKRMLGRPKKGNDYVILTYPPEDGGKFLLLQTIRSLDVSQARLKDKPPPERPHEQKLWNEDRNKHGEIPRYVETREKLFVLKKEAQHLITLTPWTEAQAVGFLLCGHVPLLPYLEVTQHYTFGAEEFGKRPGLTIEVSDLNIPAETIRRAYVAARAEMLRFYSYRTPPIKTFAEASKSAQARLRHISDQQERTLKPRVQRAKTAELLRFVSEHDDKSWLEKLNLWSKSYPKWKYDNARSMAISYYRAKKRAGF